MGFRGRGFCLCGNGLSIVQSVLTSSENTQRENALDQTTKSKNLETRQRQFTYSHRKARIYESLWLVPSAAGEPASFLFIKTSPCGNVRSSNKVIGFESWQMDCSPSSQLESIRSAEGGKWEVGMDESGKILQIRALRRNEIRHSN